jgi:hypothetical protein
MKIGEETLKVIRSELPGGGVLEVAARTGFSVTYCSLVLSGKKPLNLNNIRIINEAQKVTKEFKRAASVIGK